MAPLRRRPKVDKVTSVLPKGAAVGGSVRGSVGDGAEAVGGGVAEGGGGIVGQEVADITLRVVEACRAYGIAEPTFTEASGAITVTFKAEVVADLGRAPSQVGPKSVLSAAQVQVLEIASVARSLPNLMAPSGVKNKTRFRDQVLRPLLDAGLLEMTIPNKPRSSKQQYRTTDAGRAALATARKA